MLRTGRSDFLQVLRVGRPFFFLLGNGYGDVPAIFHLMAESLKSGFKAGDTDCRWAHVDASARLAQVKRNTDNANLTSNVGGSSSSHNRVALFSQPVRQTPIVAESLHRLSISHCDTLPRIVFHLFQFCVREILFVIFPSRS